jgi:hypothetical protein
MPTNTYRKAYRNPLDDVVKFLDKKHGDNWSIWEFRAEGTGYKDEDVKNRIFHAPWPVLLFFCLMFCAGHAYGVCLGSSSTAISAYTVDNGEYAEPSEEQQRCRSSRPLQRSAATYTDNNPLANLPPSQLAKDAQAQSAVPI